MTIPQALPLSAELRDEIVAHARCSAPGEAVGFLAGPGDGAATQALRLRNVAASGAFFVDPLSQFRAIESIKEAGLQVVAIYHSHPVGSARLSAIDIAFARRWPVPQLVIAWGCDTADDEIRAFCVSEQAVTEIELRDNGGT